jgi:hypothetical protein
MPYDLHPPLGHPEAGDWVLGALDRAEAEAFGEHLWSCARRYRIMEITAESPGDAGQHGKVVLKGTVSGG